MDHCSEEDLILQHYGEHRRRTRIERHLETCSACAAAFDALRSELSLVAPQEVPERDEHYGLAVWHRIRHRLPEQETGWRYWALWRFVSPLGAAAAVALLIIAAFVAGRSWPAEPDPIVAQTDTVEEGIGPDASERARFVALAEHFERSEHMLLDVVTADDASLDIRDQQLWAADLLMA